MENISSLFLYIPGVLIFLVGSGQVRRWMRVRRKGGCSVGNVVSCSHVVKKDKKERDIYNFYDVLVEYMDPSTGRRMRQNIKSPTEYSVGQEVRVFWNEGSGRPVVDEKEDESLFNPWITMTGGALLILLALFQNRGKELPAMICLTAVLLGAGLSMILNYILLKKKGLQPVPAEIIEVYTRQISKETKIIRGSKFTYYPVVKYTLDGKENIRRCNINSSGSGTFKVGDTMDLYLDPAKHTVVEKNARFSVLLIGILLFAAGLAAGISILSVL